VYDVSTIYYLIYCLLSFIASQCTCT